MNKNTDTQTFVEEFEIKKLNSLLGIAGIDNLEKAVREICAAVRGKIEQINNQQDITREQALENVPLLTWCLTNYEKIFETDEYHEPSYKEIEDRINALKKSISDIRTELFDAISQFITDDLSNNADFALKALKKEYDQNSLNNALRTLDENFAKFRTNVQKGNTEFKHNVDLGEQGTFQVVCGQSQCEGDVRFPSFLSENALIMSEDQLKELFKAYDDRIPETNLELLLSNLKLATKLAKEHNFTHFAEWRAVAGEGLTPDQAGDIGDKLKTSIIQDGKEFEALVSGLEDIIGKKVTRRNLFAAIHSWKNLQDQETTSTAEKKSVETQYNLNDLITSQFAMYGYQIERSNINTQIPGILYDVRKKDDQHPSAHVIISTTSAGHQGYVIETISRQMSTDITPIVICASKWFKSNDREIENNLSISELQKSQILHEVTHVIYSIEAGAHQSGNASGIRGLGLLEPNAMELITVMVEQATNNNSATENKNIRIPDELHLFKNKIKAYMEFEVHKHLSSLSSEKLAAFTLDDFKKLLQSKKEEISQELPNNVAALLDEDYSKTFKEFTHHATLDTTAKVWTYFADSVSPVLEANEKEKLEGKLRTDMGTTLIDLRNDVIAKVPAMTHQQSIGALLDT